jgi:hypothetical protein
MAQVQSPSAYMSLLTPPSSTLMCNFRASGIIFGCHHFLPIQLIEHLSSCRNRYCYSSNAHPWDCLDCRSTCHQSYKITWCQPVMSWRSTTDAKPGNQGSQLVTIARLVVVYPLVPLVQPHHVHHSDEQSFYNHQGRNSVLQCPILSLRCISNWHALLFPQDLSPREPQ